VTGQLWRVVALYRVVTLIYAAALIVHDRSGFIRPAAGFGALGAMIAWTVVTIAAYPRAGRRLPWLVTADVLVTAAIILSTRLAESAARINAGAATLPSFWAAGSVLACAVAGGPAAGLAGAAAISLAELAEREAPPQAVISGTVLLLLTGGVGGYVVRLALQAEEAVARAARLEAAAAERERIARGIHDSVLQVLALVSSRGQALGGEAAELGRLAAEQESALRALVSGAPAAGAAAAASGGEPGGRLDLRALLDPLGGLGVTVSCPAEPVLVGEAAAQAMRAAVAEALGNVARHAGPGARAWVLVEDDGRAVTVTVRDDGAGFAPGRLAQAERAGRFGVAHSIVGRLRDAGGTARIVSAPGQGTEVELRVPRS
jgi:signal transduction histidine kinase